MLKVIKTPAGPACAILDEDEDPNGNIRTGIFGHEYGRFLKLKFSDDLLDEFRPRDEHIRNTLLALGVLNLAHDGLHCLDVALWKPVLLFPAANKAILRYQTYYAMVRRPHKSIDDYIARRLADYCEVDFGTLVDALDQIHRYRFPATFYALLMKQNPELLDGVGYLFNEGAFTREELSIVTGGRSKMEPLDDSENGPSPPNTWIKNGQLIADDHMTPLAWRLVEYLWNCKHRTSRYDDKLATALYGDHDEQMVNSDLLGSHRKAANKFLKKHRCGWRVTTPQDYARIHEVTFD